MKYWCMHIRLLVDAPLGGGKAGEKGGGGVVEAETLEEALAMSKELYQLNTGDDPEGKFELDTEKPSHEVTNFPGEPLLPREVSIKLGKLAKMINCRERLDEIRAELAEAGVKSMNELRQRKATQPLLIANPNPETLH